MPLGVTTEVALAGDLITVNSKGLEEGDEGSPLKIRGREEGDEHDVDILVACAYPKGFIL